MNVTLRQLRIFRMVADGRNFSRAGDELGLTQPAVSRAIVELEAQLGLRLLDRTTREVALTQAGQSLSARVYRVLDELDEALREVAGLAGALQGTVRVASSPTLSANLMPACIAACSEQAPGVRFVLLDRIQQDVLASVRQGEVDFGVVIEPSATDDLHCETVLRDPFVLVVPRDHPLAHLKRVRWGAVSGSSLVLLDHSSGSRRLIDAALLQYGADLHVVQELGHPTTVLRMVEAGIGISVMPALAMSLTELRNLVALPLAPRVERAIMLVRRRNRAMSPIAERIWALVRETSRSQHRGVQSA